MALPTPRIKIPTADHSGSRRPSPSQTLVASAAQEAALPAVNLEVSVEDVEGFSELEDEAGSDWPFDVLKQKAVREAGLTGKTRLHTQKEKDYVDFILKAGAASTHTVSRLHSQSRKSTYRKLKWLKDNGYLDMKEFTYGPPLWSASGKREVYFSTVRHLYDTASMSLDRHEHDQIVAYLAAEWIGGLTDNFGLFGAEPAAPILAKVAQDGQLLKGDKRKVSMADYAHADAVRRKRLHSTSLTLEIAKGIRSKEEEIKRSYRARDLHYTKDDIVRNFIEFKKLTLAASDEAHFDVSEATRHAYLHPVSHDAWMAGVPIRSEDSLSGEAKIYEPDAVFYDSREGRLAIEVERSPKNRNLWWEKLWGYYKHNQQVAAMSVGGKTGSNYYDLILYVFTDKTTKENFVGMLREMRDAKPTQDNLKQKQLVKWLDEEGSLLIRELMIPKANWGPPGELISYLDLGGMLSL